MEKIHCRREKSPPIKGKSANPAPSDHQLSGRRRPDRKPSKQSVEQRLDALGGSFAGKLPERVGEIRAAAEKTATLAVENMYCAACPYIVKQSLAAVPGVKDVKVSYARTFLKKFYGRARLSWGGSMNCGQNPLRCRPRKSEAR